MISLTNNFVLGYRIGLRVFGYYYFGFIINNPNVEIFFILGLFLTSFYLILKRDMLFLIHLILIIIETIFWRYHPLIDITIMLYLVDQNYYGRTSNINITNYFTINSQNEDLIDLIGNGLVSDIVNMQNHVNGENINNQYPVTIGNVNCEMKIKLLVTNVLKDLNPPYKDDCHVCATKKVNCYYDCCNHGFCSLCMLKWALINNQCPMCKQEYKTIYEIKES